MHWRSLCAKYWQYFSQQCLIWHFYIQLVKRAAFCLKVQRKAQHHTFWATLASTSKCSEKKPGLDHLLGGLLYELFTSLHLPKGSWPLSSLKPHLAPSKGQVEHLQYGFAYLCVSVCSPTRQLEERRKHTIVYRCTSGSGWAGCNDCLWMKVHGCVLPHGNRRELKRVVETRKQVNPVEGKLEWDFVLCPSP